MEAVVLHRVGFLEYFCPKQGQDFKPSEAYSLMWGLGVGGFTLISRTLYGMQCELDVTNSLDSDEFDLWYFNSGFLKNAASIYT